VSIRNGYCEWVSLWFPEQGFPSKGRMHWGMTLDITNWEYSPGDGDGNRGKGPVLCQCKVVERLCSVPLLW
jgi:hypothetical protein